MTIDAMRARTRVVSATREFFLSRGYLETDTPALAPSLIPESCLEVFATEFRHPFEPMMPLYLIPSPEIWMKRIIAETGMSVFQICKSFRNAEAMGPVHNPEFTMLEYYTVGADSASNIALTEALFEACALPETPSWARPPFRLMTVAEAFRDLAGLDLDRLGETGAMIDAARSLGLVVPEGTNWEDAFNILFLSFVEPELPADRPLVLDEYPAGIECLARDIPGKPYKERWELYANGVEIANCFTEMADPGAVKRYFESQGARKSAALVPHAVDERYPDIFEHFPPCSGVAIGFDRFLMSLLGGKRLDEVIAFPFARFRGKN
ncbi:MAG: amino acid--tRNA ligase-related protein [Rectinemataceae bacterium]